MPNSFTFTKFAHKKFLRLEEKERERIVEKLQELKNHPSITSTLKTLVHFPPATHRLRIGQYRIILQKESANHFLILDVGHRSDIYR